MSNLSGSMDEALRASGRPRGRRKEHPRADLQRSAIIQLDADIDRAMGRVIRYAKRLEDLRAKRKRYARHLAKLLAEG